MQSITHFNKGQKKTSHSNSHNPPWCTLAGAFRLEIIVDIEKKFSIGDKVWMWTGGFDPVEVVVKDATDYGAYWCKDQKGYLHYGNVFCLYAIPADVSRLAEDMRRHAACVKTAADILEAQYK
jgi:hypothetical protein